MHQDRGSPLLDVALISGHSRFSPYVPRVRHAWQTHEGDPHPWTHGPYFNNRLSHLSISEVLWPELLCVGE